MFSRSKDLQIDLYNRCSKKIKFGDFNNKNFAAVTPRTISFPYHINEIANKDTFISITSRINLGRITWVWCPNKETRKNARKTS